MKHDQHSDQGGQHGRGSDQEKGEMTVREAGHKGGEIGGHKGGQRVRELIEEGKQAEQHDQGGRK